MILLPWFHRAAHVLWVTFVTETLFLCGITLWALHRNRNRAARALAVMDDVRVVGPLAQGLEFSDQAVRSACRDALLKLLPRLKPGDSDLLDASSRACLYKALLSGDRDLVRSVLAALEQVGDASALPFLERLSRDQRVGRDPEVQSALALCHEAVRCRVEQERASSRLLRAPEGTGAGELLRPASTGAAEVDHLLRVTEEA